MSERSNDHGVPFGEAVRVWVRVALLSFGGPAAQIAVMHRILVEEKRWVSENRFLHALNYCMLLPGPEAQQLATYIGWLLHRSRGGLVAGVLFVLPGFLCILALSMLYAGYQGLPFVEALFFGLKPAVMAVVIEAILKIGRRVLKNGTMVAIAACAFVAIFFLEVPFPLIVLAAGAVGFLGGRLRPERFLVLQLPGSKDTGPEVSQVVAPPDSLRTRRAPEKQTIAVLDVARAVGAGLGCGPIEGRDGDVALTDHADAGQRPKLARALRVAAVWLALWFGPLLGLVAWAGPDSVFVQEGVFFSKAAVVTFGGAYSVLAYVAQQAVDVFGWLQPGEMLDGLGMAETTPGPLIQVVQFVGYMGAYRNPAPLSPVAAGILGSLVTTWVTFVPCFLWIFLGAPYIEYLRGRKLLTAALSAITAAVVGVILNLASWFSLHTLFADVNETSWVGVRVFVPDLQTFDPGAAVIAVGACIAMLRYRVGMLPTLAGGVIAGALWFFATAP